MDSVPIPEEDFKLAIFECCKDPRLKRYYDFAPGSAKLYVGLTFYAMYFGDSIDKAQYYQCMKEIVADLDVAALQYLIRFETDEKYKDYLKELLVGKNSKIKEAKLQLRSQNHGESKTDYNFLAIQRRVEKSLDVENNLNETSHSYSYGAKNNWFDIGKFTNSSGCFANASAFAEILKCINGSNDCNA